MNAILLQKHYLNKGLVLLLSLFISIQVFSQDGFSVNNNSGCAPLVSTFTYIGGGSPTNLAWDFGNSVTLSGDPTVDANLLTPSVSYLTSGSYTVSLDVTTASGTVNYTSTNYITVFTDPSASFNANTITGCGAFPVTFSDLSIPGSAAIVQWNWDFGDAGSSNQQNPTHIYNTVGTFDVSLSVTDINGCNSTFSIDDYITSTDGVYPEFTVDNNYSCDIPATINIENLSTGTGTLSYDWDFGNTTTSTSENPPAVTYSDYGTYLITLELSNNLGCTQTAFQIINIQEFNVDFSAQTSCLPGPSLFASLSDPSMNTFEWDFGDPDSGTNSSTNETAAHVFSAPGTYEVTLTASIDGECETSYSMEVEIFEAAEIQLSEDSILVCNFPTDIIVEIDNLDYSSYVWFVSNEESNLFDSGSETDNILTFNNANSVIYEGNYNLTMQVNFENGCVGYLTEPVFIIVDSINFETLVDPSFLCDGTPVFASDNTSFVDPINSYTWDWGDATINTGPSAIHTYAGPGNYELTLSLSTVNGCERDTVMNISVGEETFPAFTYPDSTICVFDSIPFTFTGSGDIDNYYWFYNGLSVANSASPTFGFSVIDDTHVVSLVTENNGCLDTITVIVDVDVLGPKAEFSSIPPFFCKEEFPYIVDFLNTTETTVNTIYSWDLTGDSIPDYFGENPTDIEFIEFGNHEVTLIATDTISGCSDNQSRNILIDNYNIHFQDSTEDACETYAYSGEMFFTNTVYVDYPPEDTLFYYWDFGDGFYAVSYDEMEDDVEHFYSVPGDYEITVYSNNQKGCPDTVRQWVNIHPPPSASFSLDENICPPAYVEVTNTSTEMDTTIIDFQYFLGNASDTILFTEENPSIYIEEPVLYSLTMVIGDAFGCRDTTSQILSPHAILMDYYLPPYLCYNTEYTVQNSILSEYPPLSFYWEFGNGETSMEAEPTVYIDEAEDQLLMNYLTVTDSSGCTQLDSFNIEISVPNIAYTFGFDQAACPPIFTDFSLHSYTPADTFMIDYGDGETNYVNTIWEAQDMSHVYDFPGYYDVTFSIVDIYGCRADTLIDSLVFVPGPWASFTFSPNSGCPPLDVTFEIIEQNNVHDFLWVFGDGYTSVLEEPTHTYLLAGTFSPILIIEDSIDVSTGDSLACLITIIGEDLIIDGPILDFLVLDDTLCFGQGIGMQLENLTQTIPGFEISSYLWDFGDSTYSTEETPSAHIYDEPGHYSITLTVNTDNGCEYTLIKENIVFVMESPLVSPYIEYEPSCPPMLVNFYGDTTSTTNQDIHYFWDFGDNQQSTENSPSHEYINEGAFEPTLEISFLNCSYATSLNENIETFYVPTALLEASPLYENGDLSAVQLSNVSEDEENIEWYSDGNFISDEDQVELQVIDNNLSAFLVAYSDNNCSDTTWFSLNDFQWDIPNIITPNGDGKNDFFVLNLDGFGPCLELSIYNRWGLKIYENANYNDDWNGKDQSGDEVSDGTYFYILNICGKSKVSGYITVIQ